MKIQYFELSEFGAALGLARKHAGLSQTELAKAAGLSRAEISLLERGKENPTVKTMDALCNVLSLAVLVSVEHE